MIIITTYETTDKCGYPESYFVVYDFRSVPAEMLDRALKLFLLHAEGNVIQGYYEKGEHGKDHDFCDIKWVIDRPDTDIFMWRVERSDWVLTDFETMCRSLQ
jgi:hypothetical protein